MRRGKHSRMLFRNSRNGLSLWKCAEWLHGRRDVWFEVQSSRVDLEKGKAYSLLVYETDDYEEAKSYTMGA